MVTFNPIPGRILDVINVASLLCDYEGMLEFYQDKTGIKVDGMEAELYRYIINQRLRIDDSAKVLFQYFKNRRFFTTYLREMNAFFSFESVEAFITWLRHLDSDLFRDALLRFFYGLDGVKWEGVSVQRPMELSEQVAALTIDSESKFRLLAVLTDMEAFKALLADILFRCESVLQNLFFKYATYIKERIDIGYTEEDVKHILKAMYSENDMTSEDFLYSMSFLNDFVVSLTESDTAVCLLLGTDSIAKWKRPSKISSETEVVAIGKAVGDMSRVRILKILVDGPVYATELARRLDMAHTSLFYHIGLLHEARLILVTTVGRKTFYSVNTDRLEEISSFIVGFAKTVKERNEKK